ncbi:MAG: DUF4239 domain-containing protein [Deltaproteobacteria bacterium]|nr:DUF4239 domain-containing protein [Deltaproteobacteria bacterium]
MLPPWLVFILINAVFLTVSLLVFWGITRLLSCKKRRDLNEVASPIFNRAGAFFGFLLAFVVVVMWQEYSKAVDNASREGTEALALYRDLTLYPDKNQTNAAMKALLEFARQVVEDEYPAMAKMQPSPVTEQALQNLWKSTEKINPQGRQEEILYQVILKDLYNLSKLRNERLLELESNLPGVIWGVLIIGAMVTLIFSTLLGTESLLLHALLKSLFVILIASTFFLIIELDYPFTGNISVKPASYIRMLEMVNQK